MEDKQTLGEAREFVDENAKKGVDCPCCDQYVKIYERRLNAGAARALILMYQITVQAMPEDGWIHVQREFANNYGLNANGMDYSQPKWWNLIEPRYNYDKPDTKDSGYWRLTSSGKSFVLGHLKVQSHAKIFNNKLKGYTGDEITIRESLGKKFNYPELMGFDPNKVLPKGVLHGQENLFA